MPAAGVASLRLWWQAAAESLDYAAALARYPALAQSAAKFGASS